MKKYNIHIIRIGSVFLSFLLFFIVASCKEVRSQNKTRYKISNKKDYKSIVKDTFFISKIAQDTFGYNFYKPDGKSYHKLPVLLMMHGHGGNHYDWFDVEEGNLQHILDSLILLKKIPPLMALSIEAKNSWYVNHDSLQMEDVFFKEYIPKIKNYFGDIMDSENISLAGNSMGGYGALNYALKYPSFFNHVMLFAPAAYHPLPPKISSSRKIPVFKKNDVFNDSIWSSHSYSKIKLEKDKSIYPKFYISTGDDDEFDIFNVVVQLKSYFEKEDIKHEITVVNGKHEWKVWRECFKRDVVRLFEF